MRFYHLLKNTKTFRTANISGNLFQMVGAMHLKPNLDLLNLRNNLGAFNR